MILYKYYPCNEYTFRALSEMGLWCGPISDMNDPFDGLWINSIDFSPEDLESIRKHVKDSWSLSNHEFTLNIPYLEDNVLASFLNQIKSNLFHALNYSCLSEDPSNILMWSHYAAAHKGIVIGLNLDVNTKYNIKAIQYVKTILKTNFILLLDYVFVEKNSENIEFVQNIFSIKATCWEYEKEWRIWPNGKERYINYQINQIDSVYFGLRCPDETKTLVKSILRGHSVNDNVYHDIKIETDPEIRLTI